MLWPASDDTFYLQKNTAGAGDFSTVTNLFYIGSTQAVINVPITIPAGVAATDAVRKDQLDAKVYGGRITNGGTASVAYGPSGWTVARNSAGNTTVTHNLGTTNYSVVVTTDTQVLIGIISALATNSFTVITSNVSITAVDASYQFVLARN